MAKELIVSVNGREKKIAVLENGRVTEFYIERGEEQTGVVGSIYKGRVQRVLPGMQSAFVEIGLERDAFLYVSDFFDEEEELERIIQDKSRKPESGDSEKDAIEELKRVRFQREKEMEKVQELAEPIASEDPGEAKEAAEQEPPALSDEEQPRGKRGGRGRRGGRKNRNDQDQNRESPAEVQVGQSLIIEDSGFERIIDDESGDTGEIFKDAFMQEAIIDKVRAIEFDMETTASAPVGSLKIDTSAPGFERIADEDESEGQPGPVNSRSRGRGRGKQRSQKEQKSEQPEPIEAPKGKEAKEEGKGKKPKTAKAKKEADQAMPAEELPKEEKAKNAAAKKSARGKKPAKNAKLEDAEASLKEKPETAEMAVRRGGRGGMGRSRGTGGGRGRPIGSRPVRTEERYENSEVSESGFKEMDSGEFQEPRSGGNGNRYRSQPTISDLLREGQEILVQMAKEPIARKGARITSHISLPGRYLVYMPTVDHTGVSRKIESGNERGRLRNLIQKIRAEEDVPSGGFIVRTAGIGVPEENLRYDARYLVRTWLDIKKAAEKAKSPALVHQDLDLVERLLRDQLSDDFTAIRVDSEEEYQRIVEFINRIQPKMVNRVKLYTRDEPILEAYGVQEEINKAIKPRVWLRSGGYLVINQTEALIAIDVNTGKFVGKGATRLEDTITKTNLEAVEEIARQIRLRDLGGIIVLDLIDMEDRRNRHRVLQALQEHLQGDKSPTKVLSYNDFGLIIMTRKRVKQSLERTLCSPCEYCQGAGWVKSAQTVCFEILEEARRLSKGLEDVRHTTLRVSPDISRALRNEERLVLEEIEAYLGNVDITSDAAVHQEQFDFAFI